MAFQPTMTIIPLLLLSLLSISTANFHCPEDASRQCTPSATSGEIFSAGFNVTSQPFEYVNVECRNSHDWTGFHIKLRQFERLLLSGCELPSKVYGENIVDDGPFGDVRTKFLKVEGLKGAVKKQNFLVFPTLKTLDLSNNFLGKIEVDLIHGLRNLTHLHLQSTQIHIAPTFFSKSASLQHLDLSNNNLSNLEPGVFNGLSSLRTLNLRRNSFDFLQPKLFRGLSSLGFLDLSQCNLYALPNDIFHDIANLTFVDLSANHFVKISTNFFSWGLDRLKFVRLERNRLNVTELPARFFAELPNLRVVSLEGLGLRNLPQDVFWGSANLIELNLNENKLEELPANLLRDAGELRKLRVASNELTSVPKGLFVNAKKLLLLDLSKNRIATLDQHFSDGLHSLLELNLEGNALQSIHADALLSVRHLRVANFARNRLHFQGNLPENASPFEHCSRLEVLDLARNQLSVMLSDWTGRYERLRKLDLSYNHFTHIEANDLQFTSTRLSVDLSHNRIAIVDLSLPYLRDDCHAAAVNLTGNPIDCHCEVYRLQRYAANPEVFQQVKLQIDGLSCNRPASLRGKRLVELDDARLECTLANGRSTSCDSEGVCDCSIVPANRTLSFDCSRRKLIKAPKWISSWDDLDASVDLSGNALKKAPKMTANGYQRVRSLNLAGNHIASIHEDLASPMLRKLKLENNDLTSIDLHVAKRLTETLDSIWLGANPWLCDDSTADFRLFIQEHKFDAIVDYADVLCNDTSEPLWREPMGFLDASVLLVRGLGALIICVATLSLFFALLLYILVRFLNVAASIDSSKFPDYDAFVCHCDEDKEFVRGELATRLETGSRPYQLCIRGRDWTSSGSIAEMIGKSGRVIVVLSRDFFKQKSSRLEYEKARACGSRMIFVVRGDEEDRVCAALRAMTPRDRWIRWGDECFWERLYKAMSARR